MVCRLLKILIILNIFLIFYYNIIIKYNMNTHIPINPNIPITISILKSFHLVVVIPEEETIGSTRGRVSFINISKTSKDLIFASNILLSKQLSNSVSA